jgi:Carboxypeptidase regulatory-like domain
MSPSKSAQSRRSVMVLCLLLACFVHPSTFGQSSSATLSGTVEDQNGAVVPGATVTAENKATGLKRQATTNGEGSFTIPLLPPSTYTVTAQAQGFSPVQVSNVVLNVGDQKSLQIPLKAGNISEMVQIAGDAPLINESPAVGTVVDRQFVGNLPLNGRSFQSLIALTPGVVLTKATAGNLGQFSVNGQRASANYFTVDGVSANIGLSSSIGLSQSGAGSLPAVAITGGTNNLVSVDALQEFRIQTSTYAPEFGRSPGAQVSIITRSGTKKFHGALFEYLRNDVFDAKDWFTNSLGLPKPPLRQNDFGGVVGGPVFFPRFGEGGRPFHKADRTFFFFSYEGLRLRQPQTKITDVPSLTSRQNAVAQIQPYLNVYPIPNGAVSTNGFAKFSASYSDPSTLNATSLRIDHTANDKLTLFGRFNYAPSNNSQRASGLVSLNTLTISTVDTTTVTGGATWTPSSSVADDLRINFSKLNLSSYSKLDNFGGAVPLADPAFFPAPFSSNNSLFIFQVVGGSNSRYQAGRNADNSQNQFNLVDDLSIIKGHHQIKLGIDYRRLSPTPGPPVYSLFPNYNNIAVRVNDWYVDIAKTEGARTAALALDRTTGPFAGRLYAVWPDNRSGRSQVLLSWSDSKGDSWSAPVVVDDDLARTDPNQMPDAINVSTAVNQAGVVGVMWGDRREHADNLGWRFRFAASLDGGDSFTPSVRLASAANSYDRELQYPVVAPPTRSLGPRQPLQMRVSVMRFFYSAGDTVSMTTDQAGGFYPMWCDNRTGLSQLWTATIIVTGSALRNGNQELTDLEDVTSRVETILDDVRYDPVTDHGQLVVRLKNISANAIAGPVKARVLGLSSQLGMPKLVPDKSGRSDILMFTLDPILPNAVSGTQTMNFSLASHQRPKPGHDFVPPQLQLLTVRLRVFGGRTRDK